MKVSKCMWSNIRLSTLYKSLIILTRCTAGYKTVGSMHDICDFFPTSKFFGTCPNCSPKTLFETNIRSYWVNSIVCRPTVL